MATYTVDFALMILEVMWLHPGGMTTEQVIRHFPKSDCWQVRSALIELEHRNLVVRVRVTHCCDESWRDHVRLVPFRGFKGSFP